MDFSTLAPGTNTIGYIGLKKYSIQFEEEQNVLTGYVLDMVFPGKISFNINS